MRWIVTGTLLVAAISFASAQELDSGLTTPYQWRIAVDVLPHPFLNERFQQRIVDDVEAALKPALGEVGRVSVVNLRTLDSTLQTELDKKYLEESFPALERPEFRSLNRVKAHYLRISYRQGLYQLESRQLDGSTGLPSPFVRQRTTPTPAIVGRLAGLMLNQEFGPVATLEKISKDPHHVTATFQAGQLPGFERMVTIGNVFSVSLIREHTSTSQEEVEPSLRRFGQPSEYTLLRAEKMLKPGIWQCRVLTRFSDPLPQRRGVLGYRAIKLPTTDAPVKVRIVDDEGKSQAAEQLLQVRASDRDFSASLDRDDALQLEQGIFRSRRPLEGLACIVIGLARERSERFPVPIYDDQTVTIRFNMNEAEAENARIELAAQGLRGRVAEIRLGQEALALAFSKFLNDNRVGEALERAKIGIETLAIQDQQLSQEIDTLQKQVKDDRSYAGKLLQASQTELTYIREVREGTAQAPGGLQAKVKELETLMAQKNSPIQFEKEFRARELVERIRNLVEVGQVPQALETYDLLYDLTRNEETKKQKQALTDQWKPRTPAQAQARTYVTETWRRMDTLPQFKDAPAPLSNAAEVMITNNDRLGLRNLIGSVQPAYARLNVILESLDPNAEIDKKSVDSIREISDELRKLEEQARTAVKEIENPK